MIFLNRHFTVAVAGQPALSRPNGIHAQMIIPTLAPLFRGPLEPFANSLTLSPAENVRPASDLLNHGVLRGQIDRLASFFDDGDRRAVASIWSKSHFSTLIPVALAANLLLDLDLPVAIDQVGVVSDERGCTKQIVLPHAGAPVSLLRAAQRFDAIFEAHVTPLIAALASVSEASPKAFWSNAGYAFDAVVRQARDFGAHADAINAGLALMSARSWAGRSNPLYRPLIDHSGGRRLRRVCCLRYRATNVDYCKTCPLVPLS